MITVLSIINFFLLLVFCTLIAVEFTGGFKDTKQRITISLFCFLNFGVQYVLYILTSIDTVEKLYPLIVHLPLFLVIVLLLKRKVIHALIGIFTAYLCCQFSNWFGIFVNSLTENELVCEVTYTISLVASFYVIYRFIAPQICKSENDSKRKMLVLLIFPMAYYIFDYATSVYTKVLYDSNPLYIELLPTQICVFFFIYLLFFRNEEEKAHRLELEKITLVFQSQQSQFELNALRRAQIQSSNYRHDMRHHINMINGLLQEENIEKAKAYLSQVRSDFDSITKIRYCKNEIANLVFSSFACTAKKNGISYTVEADIPEKFNFPDTDLCSVLSNGLENAVHAACGIDDKESSRVDVKCHMHRNMLIIVIENTYSGEVKMNNGIPVSEESGHGFGCKSIFSIAEQRNGMCIFDAKNGIFTLKVVLPME